jgi:hypothetical protein
LKDLCLAAYLPDIEMVRQDEDIAVQKSDPSPRGELKASLPADLATKETQLFAVESFRLILSD